MKRSHLFTVAMAMVSIAFFASFAPAEKAAAAKSVTGKSACATCDGVTKAGHNIMITDADGSRWVLVASGKDTKGYKEAHDKRKTGVSITAVLAGEPEVKKDDAGKEYKEVKVSEVSVG